VVDYKAFLGISSNLFLLGKRPNVIEL
jgi:hypothetical protein